MKILFAASENAFGGFLGLLKTRLPDHEFTATGSFQVPDLSGYDVLIPTMTKITGDVLKSADRLKLIQQCGAGLESVDIAAARQLGVHVANVPTGESGNADSVAELGIYLMIALARNAREFPESLQNRRMGEPRGIALSGRSVGIAGLGGIGRALATRLKPFGVKLAGIKRSRFNEAKTELALDWVGGPDDLGELLSRCDFTLLCMPHNGATHHIINRRTLNAFKPGSYLINLSRGGLVDKDALAEALASGRLAGAGLDVFWEEPPDPADPIFKYNLIATPHIAGSTDISVEGIADAVAENIRRVGAGGKLLYTWNG